MSGGSGVVTAPVGNAIVSGVPVSSVQSTLVHSSQPSQQTQQQVVDSHSGMTSPLSSLGGILPSSQAAGQQQVGVLPPASMVDQLPSHQPPPSPSPLNATHPSQVVRQSPVRRCALSYCVVVLLVCRIDTKEVLWRALLQSVQLSFRQILLRVECSHTEFQRVFDVHT